MRGSSPEYYDVHCHLPKDRDHRLQLLESRTEKDHSKIQAKS